MCDQVAPSNRISGRKNLDGYGEKEEVGTGRSGSPIGSTWVLLAFAAGAAGGITLRRKK